MFDSLRRIAQGVAAIAQEIPELSRALHGLSTRAEEESGVADRVAELERSLAIRLAESNALLMEATNERKATRASEERARRRYKADRELAFLDEDGEDDGREPDGSGEDVRNGDGAVRNGEQVPAVRPLVEGSSRDDAKQAAMRYRFGRI